VKELQVTLATGETHKVALHPASTFVVRTLQDNGAGQEVLVESSWTDVADVEIVDVPDVEYPYAVISTESPHLSSPSTVVAFAQSGPVADAGQIVEQAIARYGADEPLMQEAKAIVEARMAAGGAPVEPTPAVDVDATAGAVELADEHGIDLEAIEGTGVDGRVTKADVEAAIAAQGDA
jgi:pyruvate/2-oxoglutarate dehydrogenase complex dihydrolipoamide acyltransferase (E2) component